MSSLKDLAYRKIIDSIDEVYREVGTAEESARKSLRYHLTNTMLMKPRYARALAWDKVALMGIRYTPLPMIHIICLKVDPVSDDLQMKNKMNRAYAKYRERNIVNDRYLHDPVFTTHPVPESVPLMRIFFYRQAPGLMLPGETENELKMIGRVATEVLQ